MNLSGFLTVVDGFRKLMLFKGLSSMENNGSRMFSPVTVGMFYSLHRETCLWFLSDHKGERQKSFAETTAYSSFRFSKTTSTGSGLTPAITKRKAGG